MKARCWPPPAPQHQVEILGQLPNMADQQLTHAAATTMFRGNVAEAKVEHVRAKTVFQRGVRRSVNNHL